VKQLINVAANKDASRAIMYHYVRSSSGELPYFRYLPVENFEKQICWIRRNLAVPSREEFLDCVSSGRVWRGAILTFDDGFIDHWKHVLPLLKKHNMWGIFFPTVGPLTHGEILDVHKAHLVLGKVGPQRALWKLEKVIKEDEALIEAGKESLGNAYLNQDNEPSELVFKQVLNYKLSRDQKKHVLEKLMSSVFTEVEEQAIKNTLYLDRSHIRTLKESGMLIGGHTVNHPMLSDLSFDDQMVEIKAANLLLSDLLGEKISICAYPFGIKGSFNSATQRILEGLGVKLCFLDEPRDVTIDDLRDNPLALPRYDCNALPHGVSRVGNA
jgi:peptidoglycan/xylan/chitin deacetylase (PgdA/CDA1 family)